MTVDERLVKIPIPERSPGPLGSSHGRASRHRRAAGGLQVAKAYRLARPFGTGLYARRFAPLTEPLLRRVSALRVTIPRAC
jgi:hypothetical protein